MVAFNQLHKDVLYQVAHHLGMADLIALYRVNKQCYDTVGPVLWRQEAEAASASNRGGVLHWAIEKGHGDLAIKALKCGADPNQTAWSHKPKPKARHRWWNYTHDSYERLILKARRRLTPDDALQFDKDGNSIKLDIENIQELRGCLWTGENRSYWSALHLAVSKGYITLVEKLLDHGANVNSLAWGLYKCSPYPPFKSQLSMRRDLFDTWGEPYNGENDLFRSNIKGWTPLHAAIFHGHVDVAKFLLLRGASTQVFYAGGTTWLEEYASKGDPNPITAVHEAARHNQPEILCLLLEDGYQQRTDVQLEAHPLGMPIHCAMYNGHYSTMVPLLMQLGSDVEKPMLGRTCTPMLLMIQSGRLDDAMKLMELGASPFKVDNYFSALHILAHASAVFGRESEPPFGHRAVVADCAKALISRGVQVNSGYISPLMVSSAGCDVGMMGILLQNGANPNYVGAVQDTPFSMLCGGLLHAIDNFSRRCPPFFEAGRVLVDAGMDIGAAVVDGKTTPLQHLCYLPSSLETEIVKLARYLLEKGADPNQRGLIERHPFTVAVENAAFGIAKAILQNGGLPDPEEIVQLLWKAVPQRSPSLMSFLLETRFDIPRFPIDELDKITVYAYSMGFWKSAATLIRFHGSSAIGPGAIHRSFSVDNGKDTYETDNPKPVIRALLDRGASANEIWKGETPLFYAERRGVFGFEWRESLKLLLRAGADPNMATRKMPEGAILYFARRRDWDKILVICKVYRSILAEHPEEFHQKFWGYLVDSHKRDLTHNKFIYGYYSKINLMEASTMFDLPWEEMLWFMKRGLRAVTVLADGRVLKDTLKEYGHLSLSSDEYLVEKVFQVLDNGIHTVQVTCPEDGDWGSDSDEDEGGDMDAY